MTTPEVGKGATYYMYSDRQAVTISKVSKTEVIVKRDKVVGDRTKGLEMGHQNWVITPDPEGAQYVFTLRKNGQYILKGEPMKSASRLVLTEHRHYYDWSF